MFLSTLAVSSRSDYTVIDYPTRPRDSGIFQVTVNINLKKRGGSSAKYSHTHQVNVEHRST